MSSVFASRYTIIHTRNKRGKHRWKLFDLIAGKLVSPTAIFSKRAHAEWPLAAKRDLEAYAAGLSDLDLLTIRFRMMNAREIKQARAKVK